MAITAVGAVTDGTGGAHVTDAEVERSVAERSSPDPTITLASATGDAPAADTIGTGSVVAIGCTLGSVLVIVLGVGVFLLLRFL